MKEEEKLGELKLLIKAVNGHVEDLEREALKVHAEQVAKHRVALASLRLHCGNDPRAADILAEFSPVMPPIKINKKITALKKWTTALNNDWEDKGEPEAPCNTNPSSVAHARKEKSEDGRPQNGKTNPSWR